MNNLLTSSPRADFSKIGASLKVRHPLNDARELAAAMAPRAEETDAGAREGRLQGVRRDWRILAGEWQALAGAIAQFEREFESLEQNLNRRWNRKGECFRRKTTGAGPVS